MRQLFLGAIAMFFLSAVQTQDYSHLVELKGHKVKVFHSAGYEQRAISITERVDSAMNYYQQLLESSPAVTLLVLSAEDWPKYTKMPVTGMPHYKNNKELVVAAHDNAFWRSFIPTMDKLPTALASQIINTYKNNEGELSMQPFFDLLALHELGHAFHFQEGLNMQRKWMGELFVNMLLHTFIAEKEPNSLPALTVFPQMVISKGTKDFKFTSLKDVHEKYEEIGSQHPTNYGWYQSKWHAAAAEIYNAEGSGAVKTIWNVLKHQKQTIADDDLVSFLQKTGSLGVAAMISNWK